MMNVDIRHSHYCACWSFQEDEEFSTHWEWLAEYLKTSLLKRGAVDFGCNDVSLVQSAAEEEGKVKGEIAAIEISITAAKDD